MLPLNFLTVLLTPLLLSGKSGEDQTDYVQKGKAPIIKKPGFEIYPFEESEPLLHCQPLRACDVELEAGEEILGIALGDTVRWDVQTIFSGDKDNLIPHVVVKPKDLDVTSNMVISTTKRTYHMGLISSSEEYARRFKFYYPREFITQRASKEELQENKRKEEQKNAIAELPTLSADNINFNYSIEGGSSLNWRPVRAFDDGVHVYIQMPQIMKSDEAPVLMVKRDSTNSVVMVNYRVKNNYYVVDRLFNEAMLLLGVGDDQEKVMIIKE
ncbi:MAG: P-type conjugative transfer protein TrbG [Deltaproteobacteria bacterium]|nr:P-type conjugative transfer protein TrbG [Deltaproteobacteria bacterium]